VSEVIVLSKEEYGRLVSALKRAVELAEQYRMLYLKEKRKGVSKSGGGG